MGGRVGGGAGLYENAGGDGGGGDGYELTGGFLNDEYTPGDDGGGDKGRCGGL